MDSFGGSGGRRNVQSPRVRPTSDGPTAERRYAQAVQRIRELEARIAEMSACDEGRMDDENDSIKSELREKQIELSDTKAKLLEAKKRAKAISMKMAIAERESEAAKDRLEFLSTESDKKDVTIRKLGIQLKEMEKTLKDSNEEVRRVVDLYGEMENKFGSELKRVQEIAKRTRNTAEEQQKQAKKRILELQSENDSLRIAVTEYKAMNSSMEVDQEEYQCRNMVLNEELDELKEQMQCSEDESESNDEIERLRIENEQLDLKNKALKQKVEQLSKKLEKAKTKGEERKNENEELQRQIEALCATRDLSLSGTNGELGQLQAESATLQERIRMYVDGKPDGIFASPGRDSRELDEERERLRNSENEFHIEEENTILKTKLADMTRVVEELTHEGASGFSSFGGSTLLENQTLLETIAELRRENEALKNENQSQVQLNDTTEDWSNIDGVNQSLLEDIKRLREENRKLKEENEEIHQSHLEESKPSRVGSQDESSGQELVESIDHEESEDLLKSDVDGEEEEEEHHRDHPMSEGEVATSDSETTREEIESLHNSFSMNDQYTKMCEENDQLRDYIEKLQADFDDLQARQDNLIACQLHSTIDALEEVQINSQDLKQRSLDFGAMTQENSLLKHRVFGLESQILDYQRMITTGQGGNEVINGLIRENEELKEQISELKKGLDPSRCLKQAERMKAMLDGDDDTSSEDGDGEDVTPAEEMDLISIKQENATLKKIIDSFDPSIQNVELAHKLQELQRCCTEAEERVRSLEASNQEMAQWLTDNSAKQDELIQQYRTQNAELKETLTKLRNQGEQDGHGDFYTDNALLTREVNDLKAEIDRLTTFRDDVVENLQEQVEYLQSTVDIVTSEKEELERRAKDQECMIRRLDEQKVKEAQLRLESLQKELKIQEQKETIDDMSKRLEAFTQETNLMRGRVDDAIEAFESQSDHLQMQQELNEIQDRLAATMQENQQLRAALGQRDPDSPEEEEDEGDF